MISEISHLFKPPQNYKRMIVPARVAAKICPYIQLFATFDHIRVFSDDLPAISDETYIHKKKTDT